jgi:hypothetical protein
MTSNWESENKIVVIAALMAHSALDCDWTGLDAEFFYLIVATQFRIPIFAYFFSMSISTTGNGAVRRMLDGLAVADCDVKVKCRIPEVLTP